VIHEEINRRGSHNSKLQAGYCSYKMPKIRVVSKDSTQRHLRMVLDGITTRKMKMPLSSKSALENGGRNYFLGNNNNLAN